jgi:ketosteroid isomerase-like protein
VGENGDFVRRWVEAWNRGELEALIADSSPEIEWVVTREHPDATTHHGVDAVAAYLRDWLTTMPDLRVEIVELEEVGDKVLVVLRLTGTGAGSGAATDVRTAMISTFREARAVRTEEFLDIDEARRALAAA